MKTIEHLHFKECGKDMKYIIIYKKYSIFEPDRPYGVFTTEELEKLIAEDIEEPEIEAIFEVKQFKF